MTDVGAMILDAASTLGASGRVALVQEPEASAVINKLAAAFLTMHRCRWWWEHLEPPAASWATPDGYRHIPRLSSTPEEACWLIGDLEEDAVSVVRCTPALAALIIGECSYFEYAVADVALGWLVIESHHDVLFAAGTAAVRLEQLREEG